MSNGGWPASGPRHGRHRRGWVNSAWTPAVRPNESGRLPSHARIPWAPRPGDGHTSPPAVIPRRREPVAEEMTASGPPVPKRVVLDVEAPKPAEPEPAGRGSAEEAEGAAEYTAIVHAIPETPPQGLRKFDLGIVPASVTPPSSWRRAAWFAVGTSAAVVCGLAVAAVRFVGSPHSADTIDALPAFPTQKLGKLPADETARPTQDSRTPTTEVSSRRTDDPTPGSAGPGAASSDEPAGESGSGTTSGTGDSTSEPTTWTQTPPPRATIGPQPVTPTNPQAMGDRTEQYFALVTEDPEAAHEMCTGSMAREGPEGIEERYAGVDHVEVQDITINRNEATTTSTVKIVHDDGTATVEQRELTFTWGGDPKISDETPAA
jgi:hypothetical protein